MIQQARRRRQGPITMAWLFVLAIAAAPSAHGQTPLPCERPVLTLTEAAALLRLEAGEVARLAEKGQLPGRLVGPVWRFSCAALMTWLTGEPGPPVPAPPIPMTATQVGAEAGTGLVSSQAADQAVGVPPADRQDRPVGEAPRERPADDVSLRGQRVLLGRGDVVLDVGQFYARTDDHVLAAVGGAIGLATARQQRLTSIVQARVGLFTETELVASATFDRQDDSLGLGGRTLAEDRRRQWGGLTLGVRRTLLHEGPRRPNVIATLDGHLPTGDRPRVVGAGLVFVKSVDPVALFLTLNYARILGSDASSGGPPRDTGAISVGYALALNETLAISMAVSGAFAGAGTGLDEAGVRHPGTFSARFGVTSWLARGLYIEPSVSLALTGPGSGLAFGVSLPYSF